MLRRWWMWAALFGLASVFGAAQDELARAQRISREAIGIDSHIDTLQRILTENVDIGQRLPGGHVDIPRLKEAGMHAPFFALWAPNILQRRRSSAAHAAYPAGMRTVSQNPQ